MRLLALVLLVGWAGCLTPEDDFEPWRNLTAFHAEFRAQGHEVVSTLDLSGPVEILDREGRATTGYRLDYQFRSVPPESVTFILDQDLRVVAEVTHCNGAIINCSALSRVSWSGAGDLAPFGVGLAHLMARDGSLVSFLGDVAREVPARQQKGDLLVMDVEAPYRSIWSSSWNGTMRFAPGQHAPLRDGYELLAYEPGPPMEMASAHVTIRVPPARPWQGTFFPGESADLFDWGMSSAELLAAAAAETPGTDCTILAAFNDLAARPPGPLPATNPERLGTALVTRGRAEGAMDVRLDLERRPLTGEPEIANVRATATPAFTKCPALLETPWPAVGLSDAIEKGSTLISSAANLSSITLSAADRTAFFGRPAPNGWHVWTLGYTPVDAPRGQFYDPRTLDFAAWDGSLWGASLPPQELVAWVGPAAQPPTAARI